MIKKQKKKTTSEDLDTPITVGLYVHVDLLNYWGSWKSQYLVVDKFMNNWVICEHWYSRNSHDEQFSQLGEPLIVNTDRIRVSSEKSNRTLPWDWYKSTEDFVRFCKGRVGGIGTPRSLAKSEIAAYCK